MFNRIVAYSSSPDMARLAANAAKKAASEAKAKSTLEAAGLSKCWEIYESRLTVEIQRYEESLITDIVAKLVRYGSISEKQEVFLHKLLVRIDGRSAVDAARAAEHAAADDIPAALLAAPAGRVIVEGVVVSIKETDSRFGTQTKMVVKADDGWKVYGTKPAALDAKVGDRVRFECGIASSHKDPKFGFFSRPKSAVVVTAGSERTDAPTTDSVPAGTPVGAVLRKYYPRRKRSYPAPTPKPAPAPTVAFSDEPVEEPVWPLENTPRASVGNAAIYLLNAAAEEGRLAEMDDPTSPLMAAVATLTVLQGQL